MKHLSSQTATIAALFFVIIIDQMGITFIFPILTPLFMEPNTSNIVAQFSPALRDFFYGLCLALYPLFMFFGAPMLGDLSDQVGRKRILLICLVGSALSFLLSAVAVAYNSLSLLLLCRALAGFFGGSQYIAQAAIADVSTPENKAVNLSYIIVAISIGMVFGPLVGGYFTDVHLASWFTYSTPFEIAALLAFINAATLLVSFKETFTPARNIKLKLFKGFQLFKDAFADKKIRLLSSVLFFMMFAWTLYFASISWLLLQVYHFGANELGLFVGYIGVAFTIALTVVLRLLLKYFKPLKILLICFGVFILALLLAFSNFMEIAQWVAAALIVGSMAVNYTMLLALFSDAAGKEAQGWIMGISGAVVSIAWTIAGLIAGPLGFVAINLPMLVSAILGGIALIGILNYNKKS